MPAAVAKAAIHQHDKLGSLIAGANGLANGARMGDSDSDSDVEDVSPALPPVSVSQVRLTSEQLMLHNPAYEETEDMESQPTKVSPPRSVQHRRASCYADIAHYVPLAAWNGPVGLGTMFSALGWAVARGTPDHQSFRAHQISVAVLCPSVDPCRQSATPMRAQWINRPGPAALSVAPWKPALFHTISPSLHPQLPQQAT